MSGHHRHRPPDRLRQPERTQRLRWEDVIAKSGGDKAAEARIAKYRDRQERVYNRPWWRFVRWLYRGSR